MENTINMPLKKQPLVEEGDLRDVYRSKTQTLPEILNSTSFYVNKEVIAQTSNVDVEFGKEAINVISALDDLPGTYIFVDIGHAHLPSVAAALASYGVDTHFVIPGKIHNRFKETLKYWAREFKTTQDKIESPVTYATLVDGHRSGIEPTYELTESQLPSVERLRELGITKVICLTERKAGDVYKPIGDAWEVLRMNYEEQGLQFQCRGIDPR